MKLKVMIFSLLMFAHTFIPLAVFGQGSELVFPIEESSPSVLPEVAGFAFGGKVGFNLVLTKLPYKYILFSFSVSPARIIDRVDLEPDFGSSQESATIPRIFLKVNDQRGLAFVFGQHTNGAQCLFAFQSETNGLLRRLWSVSYPRNAFLSAESDLAVNADASRLCWIHYFPRESALPPNPSQLAITSSTLRTLSLWPSPSDPVNRTEPYLTLTSLVTRQLSFIRATDGAQLAMTELPFNSIFTSVFFDEAQRRVVAIADKTVIVFATSFDRLDPESTFSPAMSSSDVVGQGITKDGRFLLAYGGYKPDPNESKSGLNYYISFDLEMHSASELALRETFFPISNGITFHQAKAMLFAPLTADLTFGSGVTPSRSSRDVDILGLQQDGSLTRICQVKLPKRSTGSLSPNALSSYCNIEVSESGAMAFIPSGNGRLFTVDTADGEIIRDILINPNGGLVSIKVLEPLKRLVASDHTNRFLLLDATTGPVISSIAVKRKSTIISGENFLNGAHVLFDGIDLGIANRSANYPGREIVLDRGKKDFTRGQLLRFMIVNPDGLTSNEFTIQR